MPGPATYGGLGVRGGGLGLMGLGAPQQPQPFAFPVMPATTLPYIAHLYTNTMQFKRTLGDAASVGGSAGSALMTKPGLKMTLNGGYHPITLELAGAQPPLNLAPNPSFEPVRDTTTWSIYNNGPEAAAIADIANGTAFDKANFIRVTWSVANTSTKGIYFSGAPAFFTARQMFVVSFYARGTGGAVGSLMNLYWNVNPTNQVALSNPALTAAWQRYAFQITWGALFDPNLFISITASGGQAAGSLELDAVQVETGNQATAWAPAAIRLGDIIQLTEQGDNSGAVLYTGIVEEIPDEVGVGATGSKHQVTLTPLVAELGDTPFNQQYATLVDVAQMVRDAVSATAHLRVSQISCGDTGVLAIYNFTQNALEVVNVAKRIAGVNFWWFVDATGLVWFQATTPTNPARVTLKRGSDFTWRKWTPSIVGLKNFIRALGGFPAGVAVALQSTYSNATSQKAYGKRALDPPLILPTVTDQGTLDKITATLGAAFDRVQTMVQLEAPLYASRLTLGVPGGLTTRLFEPANESIAQPTALGTGGYLGPYVAQDIEVNGPSQKITTSDIPVAGMADMQHELDRIIQRVGMAPASF